eukprot:m.208936 g.208936  ORF g.208936 m.208936 type:complete len:51 (+) comp33024_c1_seq3:142-294(+)
MIPGLELQTHSNTHAPTFITTTHSQYIRHTATTYLINVLCRKQPTHEQKS